LDEPDISEMEKDIQRLQQQLNLLDNRLDNIDSMVTAVAERVMSQLVTLNLSCPHCGKNIEIAVVGNQRPTR
jgi:prefoldin subunit 5